MASSVGPRPHTRERSAAQTRSPLEADLEGSLARERAGGAAVGVLYLVVDDLDAASDHHGRTVADDVLVELATRARVAGTVEDRSYRVGDDELVVLCDGMNETAALAFGERLHRVLGPPFQVDDRELSVNVSIGVAGAGRGPDAATVIAAASARARAQAERLGHARVRDPLGLHAHLLDAVGEALIAWDPSGTIRYANPAAGRLWGWNPEAIVGTEVVEATCPDMEPPVLAAAGAAMVAELGWSGEFDVRRADGSRVPVLSTHTPVYAEGELAGYIGVSIDLTERRQAAAKLAHQASHDSLTDLPNRSAMADAIDADLRSARPGRDGVFLLAELGRIELLSDASGRALGDQVIRQCAQDLAGAADPGDLVARVSDRTFAVWRPEPMAQEEALALGRRISALLAASGAVAGIGVHLQVSAAVVQVGSDVGHASDLFSQAESALAYARTDRSTAIYDTSMRRALLRQVAVQELVDRTLEADVVSLGYQAIVRLEDGCTVGAEALLRLVDDDGVPVPAEEVVQAAERTGRMRELGDLVLRTACRDAADWRSSLPERTVRVSVNLSARELDDPRLPDRVAAALSAATLDPSALCLEVTESAIMTDPDRSARILAQLKAQGVRLSADDFGTGYSSLAYLKAFPIDELKIDRSFVSGLPENLEDVAIVQAILAMAEALGLSVVVEGIETEANLQGLLDLGASYGQGYLWSQALTAAELVARLGAEEATTIPAASAPEGDVSGFMAGAVRSERAVTERIDSILKVVGHELRGPLAVIDGYASLLQDEGSARTAQAARSINRAVGRLDEMIDGFVAVAESEEVTTPGEFVPLEVGPLLELMVADLNQAFAGRVLLLHRPSSPLWVLADRSQLGEVVHNIVANADRFAPMGTPIEVGLALEPGWVEITISDRGPGVHPEQLGLIFRKYGRADPRRGTGLGLYLARRIARTHGGDVLYRRRFPAPGASFCIRLPQSVAP